jgi:hypothetical protein
VQGLLLLVFFHNGCVDFVDFVYKVLYYIFYYFYILLLFNIICLGGGGGDTSGGVGQEVTAAAAVAAVVTIMCQRIYETHITSTQSAHYMGLVPGQARGHGRDSTSGEVGQTEMAEAVSA